MAIHLYPPECIDNNDRITQNARDVESELFALGHSIRLLSMAGFAGLSPAVSGLT